MVESNIIPLVFWAEKYGYIPWRTCSAYKCSPNHSSGVVPHVLALKAPSLSEQLSLRKLQDISYRHDHSYCGLFLIPLTQSRNICHCNDCYTL